MKFNGIDNNSGELPLLFVHSLFRSGSTYFYHAIKRTEKYYPYHEPFHEIIGQLAGSWAGISGRSDQIKADLRHGFMKGGYFDEYSRVLPYVKEVFSERLSYEYFFLDQRVVAEDQVSYIKVLVDGAPLRPVLQCTRTIGRVQWFKLNFDSNHIFLLRNPWDQWYSYKVDPYISSTPQVILSQPDAPEALIDVAKHCGVALLQGDGVNEKLRYAYAHPVTPEANYAMFFAVWAYSFIAAKRHCDLVVDMDLVCSDQAYRSAAVEKLAGIGLEGVDLSDADLPNAIFEPKEQRFYELIEDQVLEVFRNHKVSLEEISDIRTYLDGRRKVSFRGAKSSASSGATVLNDAKRLRDVIMSENRHAASVTSGLWETIEIRNREIAEAGLLVGQAHDEAASLRAEVGDITDKYEQSLADVRASSDLYNAKANELAAALDEVGRLSVFEGALAQKNAELLSAANELVSAKNELVGAKNELAQREEDLSRSQDTLSHVEKQSSNHERTGKLLRYELAATNHAVDTYRNHLTSDIEGRIRRGRGVAGQLSKLLRGGRPDRFERMDADARKIEAFLDQFSDEQLAMPRAGRRQRILRYLAGLTPFVEDFPIFDRSIYEQLHADVASAKLDAFVHFIDFGRREGRLVHPIIDRDYYLGHYPEVGVLDMSVVEHFVRFGADKGYNPCALFDVKWYRETYPDVKASGCNPVLHFLRHPRCAPHPLFDADYYLEMYHDVAAGNMNPLTHYLMHGHGEGRTGMRLRKPAVPAPTKKSATPGSSERKIALMVNAFYPHPDEDAGSLEQVSFARIFQSLGYEVAYAGLLDFGTKDKYRDALEAMGVHCVTSDDYNNLEEYLFLNAEFLEVAFMSRVHWGGAWIDQVKLFCPGAKIIFNTVDLHYIREERQAALAGDAAGIAEAQKTKEVEFKCIRAADVTIVLSTTELDILNKEIPDANVTIVPIMREIGDYDFADFSKRRDIAFIGGFQHQPNVDAVEYFLSDVWPLVLKELPDLRVKIIGSHLPATLSSRPDRNVDWVGYVPEIDPELDRLKLTIAPLRYGAGAKGKVVSSLARGVPCVATPIAAEGMGFEDGVNIAVGSTPAEFASAIVRLYETPAEWDRISRAGFALIQRDYSLDTGKRLVNDILAHD